MPVEKPSEQEEEYFARLEFERRRKAAEEERQRLEAEEPKRLRDLHYMRCPKCGAELAAIAYRGIELDKCTACQGVWLDCGEIEQLGGAEGGLLGGLLKIFR
ncbi:MAG: zf-TFIIB domain-containing protein [Candidatus Entotheonellia bacterium]